MKATLSLAVLCLLGEVSAKHHLKQQHARWEADYQGKYAQHGSRHHHKHHHDHARVQTTDHKNDTDDIVEDGKMDGYMVQLNDHENDTEDLPAGMDPYQLMQVQLVEGQKKNAQKWEDDYQKQEEEDSFEFVQTAYDHDNDTEDMPQGLDPIDLDGAVHTSSFALAEQAKEKEVQAIIDDSGEDLVQLNDYGTTIHNYSNDDDDFVQLSNKDYGVVQHHAMEDDDTNVFLSYESHAGDTEDIADDQAPDMYDHHHSKMWNSMVEKKALELEQTMKIEENMEESKVKAKEEAERRASIVKFNEEQEKKKQLAQLNQKKNKEGSLEQQRKENPYKTIDLSEVYSTMV